MAPSSTSETCLGQDNLVSQHTSWACNLMAMSMADRIKRAREAQGLSQPGLGEKLGVSGQSVQQWEAGETAPRRSRIAKIAAACRVAPEWLEFGDRAAEPSGAYETGAIPGQQPILEWENPDDLPEGQFIVLPSYRVHVSAGDGQVVFEEEEEDRGKAFRTDWLREKGLRRQDLACVYATGDSMEPRIRGGDLLVVNLHPDARQVRDGQVYVIRYGDEVRVKRIYKLPDGGLIIHSDNDRDYPQIRLTADELDNNVAVIGEVIWVGGEI